MTVPDLLAVWVLDVSTAGPSEAWVDVLDEDERRRAAAFVFDVDRHRYTAAHAGLRLLLGRTLGIEPGAVQLTRRPCVHCGGPHGKPEVVGGPQWSMTHSGDLALYAVAPWPVGVDVERTDRAVDVAGLAGYLHPREQAEIAAEPPESAETAFYRCWTRKEAFLKGTGAGLNESLSRWYVGTGPSTVDTPEGWSLVDIPVAAGYLAAVAVHRRPPPPWSTHDLVLDR